MMKRKLFLFTLCLFLLLSACSLPQKQESQGVSQNNVQPMAWIDAPLNESRLPMEPYEIVFHVSGSQVILKGEISLDDNVIAFLDMPDSTENLTTWKYTWVPESAGKHIIRVRGQNTEGIWSNQHSAVVYIEGETPTFTPTTEINATPSTTPTPFAGFSNFAASPSSVHFGSCTPNQVTVSADVIDTTGITTVVLFYRMRDENGQATDWANVAMNPGTGNQYSKTLNLSSFESSYASGTLDIQLVIQNSNGEYIRSEVYSQVGISSCLQPLFELENSGLQIIPLIPTNTPIVVK